MKRILLLLIMTLSGNLHAQKIDRLEYYIDADPGYGEGVNIPVESGGTIDKTFAVDLSEVEAGIHILYTRVRDDKGHWSQAFAKPLYIYRFFVDEETGTPDIVQAEYYIDTDPGYGKGVNIPVESGGTIDKSFAVDLNVVEAGIHVLYTRVRDDNGQWSHAFAKPLYIYRFFVDEETGTPDIVQAEYYIDTDPGYGEGVNIPVESGGTIDKTFAVDLSVVEAGIHVLYTRVRDDNEQWSHAFAKPFYIYQMPEEIVPPDIVAFEYYLTDGEQSTTPVTVDTFTPAHEIETEIAVDLSNLVIGKIYTMITAAVDENGRRSLPYAHMIMVSDAIVFLTSPLGGEIWTGGSNQTITWKSVNVNNISIEYSTDGGSGWTKIITIVDAYEGSFTWTVPDTPSENCLVRITSVSDASLTSTSENVFTILPEPALTVTLPTGGEQWTSGTLREITWTTVNVATVRIDYSTDGGSTWSVISESFDAAKGNLPWTVPETPSEQCLVRITSVEDETVTGQSGEVFTILPPPSITLIAPNGGEVWIAGSEQKIEWTSVNVGGVKIEYSADNGETWAVVKAGIAASNGFFLWEVPATLSVTCLVRLTDTSNDSVADLSDAAFSIVEPQAYVTMISPKGGEEWIRGERHSITWKSGKVESVTIEFSTDGGETWIVIGKGLDADTELYEWTVPDSISVQCLVRITDTSAPDVTDRSDSVFSIVPEPFITVISPGSGEEWAAVTPRVITWTSANIETVIIKYSVDGGKSWGTIVENVDAASGSYSWTTPDITSSECLIKISDAGNQELYGQSNEFFTIAQEPEVEIVSPNGGEEWATSSTQTIEWTYINIDNITLEYSTDGGSNWNEIASQVDASAGSYSWTVPDIESSDCKIKITSVDDAGITDESDEVFSIIKKPAIEVTSPNGGESWQEGSVHEITWSYVNVDSVKLEYTFDNGSTWNVIIASTDASTGKYQWEIPDIESADCKIRVTATDDTGVTDESDASFAISSVGIWGDVNDNGTVNSADGLIIASYGIDIPVGAYEENVLSRGDVNGDGTPDLADGLICARYGIQPDYAELPARVGQPLGTVAKVVVLPVETTNETAVPHISMLSTGKQEVIVETSVGTRSADVPIGAASILIRWDPAAYRFKGIEKDHNKSVVINKDTVESGEIRISMINVDGCVLLSFPYIKLNPSGDGGTDFVTTEVLEAIHAETFAKLNIAHDRIAVGGSRENNRPVLFELEQNIPNPFNPSTTIHYTITESAFVNLNIYNIQGQKVKTLADRFETAGFHSVTWNGTDDRGMSVSSGVYIYQLVTHECKVQKQMLLVR